MNSRIGKSAVALTCAGALAIAVLPVIAHAATSTPTPTASASVTATPSPTSSSSPVIALSGAEITKLPARAELIGGQTPAQFVSVKLIVRPGTNCSEDFKASSVGQSKAVTVSAVPDCTSAGFAKWTVLAKSATTKANAVVKFIGPNAAGQSRTIGSLIVKVNPGAKPGKPTASAKPTTTATSSATPTASTASTPAKPGKPTKAPKP